MTWNRPIAVRHLPPPDKIHTFGIVKVMFIFLGATASGLIIALLYFVLSHGIVR
jgi:hypothetical protein